MSDEISAEKSAVTVSTPRRPADRGRAWRSGSRACCRRGPTPRCSTSPRRTRTACPARPCSSTRCGPRTASGSTTRSVARVAPDSSDVPVFPSYDFEMQFGVMQLVGEHAPGRAGARGAVARARPVGHRCALLRDGPRVGPGASRQHALPDGQLAARGRPGRPAGAAGRQRAGAGRHPRHRRRRRRLAPSSSSTPRRHRRCAATSPTSATYYDWMRDGRVYPVIEEAFDWLDDQLARPTRATPSSAGATPASAT